MLRVRDQAILQLLGTNFPWVIGSKKHENFKSGIFSIIFDSMALGYTIQALITAIFRLF